ncbi:class II aldolase/adducin family protein [Nocardia yamanashiensis]|uniref:class II aldolase/adducin family protein n=1 Tax=Nocardia yamanashiensis TaxID=209247 RepID=UPI000A013359|nr:class II aldolase/adducin family protein [Nocardia yamanashiensis]
MSEASTQAHLADTATGLPIPGPPVFERVDDERRYRKQRLAAAIRLFGRHGFGEGISGHISVRDPEHPDLFWVNPFGISFRRCRVSDLICVDGDGVVVSGRHRVNPSAFAIHSQIHRLCPNSDGIAHGHTKYSRALGAIGQRLLPIDQESAAFHRNHVLFDDYNGPAIDVRQGQRIAAELGDNAAILLRHHGLITKGGSLEEAVHWFFTFEGSARVQLLAAAAGSPHVMNQEQAELARAGFGDSQLAWFSFQLLWEEIVHDEPDFLDE